MNRILLAVAVAGLLAVGSTVSHPTPVAAHGGGVDSYGCHNDRKGGTYHCHRGSCTGQTFASQRDMLAAACNKTTKPRATTAVQPATNTPKATSASTLATTRDEDGRIQRSAAARKAFMQQTGYPNGRPGYVVDHIRPLACGGADEPYNMQWQTIAQAKAKDAWERAGCK